MKITKRYKYLGVVKADPIEYSKKYNSSLLKCNQIPQFVSEIQTPKGLELAADKMKDVLSYPELEGDLYALKLINLEKEGLSMYKKYQEQSVDTSQVVNGKRLNFQEPIESIRVISDTDVPLNCHEDTCKKEFMILLKQVFVELDKKCRGRISLHDAIEALININARLIKSLNEEEMIAYFNGLKTDSNKTLTFEEFKNAFEFIFF